MNKLLPSIIAAALGIALNMGATSLAIAETGSENQSVPIEDVQRFSKAISQIKQYYIKPVKNQVLFENAIRGMLTGLDPHSAFLDSDEFKDLQATTRGEFSGLGIEVTMENGLIKVISPIDDTPAEKAGIKAGDLIVRLDNTPVKGLTLRDAVNKMRGKKGTSIQLIILRKGATAPITYKVTRAKIAVRSVKSRIIQKKYGYIRISHFQSLTGRDIKKAVKTLRKKAGGHLRGIVLDLRNNPGGLLDAAIETSDAFIHNDQKNKEELIVYTKGRVPGADFTAIATPGDILNNAPIIVLINGGSASGSEIVAGALKDNKRAILLGTKSFGKGSVQTILPLGQSSGIKLTTSLYYTPSGQSIQAKGITPDIVVENIKIPAPKKNQIDALTEAHLSGHLKNTGSVKDRGKKAKNAKNKSLIHKDYQLYHALNLLKGMTVLKR